MKIRIKSLNRQIRNHILLILAVLYVSLIQHIVSDSALLSRLRAPSKFLIPLMDPKIISRSYLMLSASIRPAKY